MEGVGAFVEVVEDYVGPYWRWGWGKRDLRHELVGVPGGAGEGKERWRLGRPGGAVYEAFGVVAVDG